MTIPFLDTTRLHASIRDELDEAIGTVINGSSFVGAAASWSFETAFATAHGLGHALGCGSGTDALTLALVAAGIGAGDEVIVPSLTFVATAEAVVHAGATPVLADVDPITLLLSEETVAESRGPSSRAVIPVHLFGNMVDPAAMAAWRDDGLIVIEDAAQAHLANFNGTRVGSVGNAACFSFYPGKNLGALGDGGAVLTNDQEIADSVSMLRDHGSRDKYVHERIGWCSRLDGIQAAVLEVKVRYLPQWTESRRGLAEDYHERLGDLVVPWTRGAVHHLLPVRVPADRRTTIVSELGARRIQTGIHYPVPLSQQPSLRQWARRTPHAEHAASELLSLPLDPLMTEAEVDQVSAALLTIL